MSIRSGPPTATATTLANSHRRCVGNQRRAGNRSRLIFNQDLNGDGTIGVVTTVIQTDGSTSLTEVGNEYYLYHNGSGPALKYGGADVAAGSWRLDADRRGADGKRL